jgi:predicted lipoprotein with Yx(FWY)xxD motif
MLTHSKTVTLGVLLLVMMLLVAACAPAAAPAAPAQAPAAAPTAAPVAVSNASSGNTAAASVAAGPVVLAVANNDKLGKFLTDDKGMTLYMYTKDTKDTSNCYDKCAQAWPPLLQSGKPTVKDGVDASLLGTTTRKDGMVQVTYAGMPLYYYFKDKAAGDVTGQDSNSVWYVVAPDGSVVKK